MLRRLKRTIDTLRRPVYRFAYTAAPYIYPSAWHCNLCERLVLSNQLTFHASSQHGFRGEHVRIESPAS